MHIVIHCYATMSTQCRVAAVEREQMEESNKEEWVERFNNALSVKWYAQPDDLIGGWCVSIIDRPPSEGPGNIGDFMSEDIARHVVETHNRWLFLERIKNEIDSIKAPCGCSSSLSGRFIHEVNCTHFSGIPQTSSIATSHTKLITEAVDDVVNQFVEEREARRVNFQTVDEDTEEPYTWDSFKSP